MYVYMCFLYSYLQIHSAHQAPWIQRKSSKRGIQDKQHSPFHSPAPSSCMTASASVVSITAHWRAKSATVHPIRDLCRCMLKSKQRGNSSARRHRLMQPSEKSADAAAGAADWAGS